MSDLKYFIIFFKIFIIIILKNFWNECLTHMNGKSWALTGSI